MWNSAGKKMLIKIQQRMFHLVFVKYLENDSIVRIFSWVINYRYSFYVIFRLLTCFSSSYLSSYLQYTIFHLKDNIVSYLYVHALTICDKMSILAIFMSFRVVDTHTWPKQTSNLWEQKIRSKEKNQHSFTHTISF